MTKVSEKRILFENRVEIKRKKAPQFPERLRDL
jgi:hypothetical protein